MRDSFLTGGTPVPQVVSSSAVAAPAMLDAEASAQFGTDLVVANDIGLHDEIAGFMRRLPRSTTPARRRHTLVFENREGVA